MSDDYPRQREVARQATVGAFNRRAFASAQNFDRAYTLSGFTAGNLGEFLCTCGRDDCDEILELPLDEYRFVQEKPYRFIVAHGHAADVDDVIRSSDSYDVVEVKPEYRELAATIIEARARDAERSGHETDQGNPAG